MYRETLSFIIILEYLIMYHNICKNVTQEFLNKCLDAWLYVAGELFISILSIRRNGLQPRVEAIEVLLEVELMEPIVVMFAVVEDQILCLMPRLVTIALVDWLLAVRLHVLRLFDAYGMNKKQKYMFIDLIRFFFLSIFVDLIALETNKKWAKIATFAYFRKFYFFLQIMNFFCQYYSAN